MVRQVPRSRVAVHRALVPRDLLHNLRAVDHHKTFALLVHNPNHRVPDLHVLHRPALRQVVHRRRGAPKVDAVTSHQVPSSISSLRGIKSLRAVSTWLLLAK